MAKDLKKQAKKLKRKGRNGDTMLAHISPEEDRFLTQLGGGKKSRNPDTGLPEHFFGIDDAIIGSILMSAGIGAVSSAATGGNPLKGALMGGLGGALFQGIGGLMGAGAGAGTAAATDTAANIAAAGAEPGLASASLLSDMNAADVAARSAGDSFFDSFGTKAGDFLKSPTGMITGIGALSSIGSGAPEEEMEESPYNRAYPKFEPMNRKPKFAEGGAVNDEDQDYVDNVYNSAYDSHGNRTGVLEDLYADPFLFRGYQVDAQGQQTPLPPTYVPGNNVYSRPNLGSMLQGIPQDIADQITSGIEQFGPNMLSRIAGFAGAAGNPGGTGIGGAGGGDSSEQNYFPEDPTKKPDAPIKSPMKIMSVTQAPRDYYGMNGRSETSPYTMTFNDGRTYVPKNSKAFEDFVTLSKMGPNTQNMLSNAAFDDELPDWLKQSGYQQYNTYGDVLRGMSPDFQFSKGGPVNGIGGGKDDKIPAMLSDGEHVVTADEVSMLGDGSNPTGQKKMYQFRKNLRKQKTGRAKQMPKAKSVEKYVGIGG